MKIELMSVTTVVDMPCGCMYVIITVENPNEHFIALAVR